MSQTKRVLSGLAAGIVVGILLAWHAWGSLTRTPRVG